MNYHPVTSVKFPLGEVVLAEDFLVTNPDRSRTVVELGVSAL